MRMRTAGSFITSCFLVLALTATASGEEDVKSAFAMGEPLNPAQRQQLARLWGEDIKRLNDAIPTLSPSQEAWLQREYHDEIASGIYTSRALNAMNSREYYIWLAKSFASSNATIVAKLADGKAADRNEEALLWAILANSLLDREFGQAVLALVDERVIDKSVLGKDDYIQHYIENQQLWGQTILARLVIPYLADTAGVQVEFPRE